MTTTERTPSSLTVPAVHIEAPRWTPSVEQVWASIDTDSHSATGEITTLVSVVSGEVTVELQRYDWPGDRSQIEARINVTQPGDDIDEYIAGGINPEIVWYRLTELASAASVAAQRLQVLIDAGQVGQSPGWS